MDSQSPLHNLAYTLFTYIWLLIIAAVLVGFFVWLIRLYKKTRKANKSSNLSSKIWYCQQCWYYEYAAASRQCPNCAERNKQEDPWLPVPDLSRGQPSQETYYKTMQRILNNS